MNNNMITTALINIIKNITLNNEQIANLNLLKGSHNYIKVTTKKAIDFHKAVNAVYVVAKKYINNKAKVELFDNATILISKPINNSNYKPITWIRIT